MEAITVRPSLDRPRSVCVTKKAEALQNGYTWDLWSYHHWSRQKCCLSPYLSRPLVGSSRKSNLGRIRISRAMLTLLFSPPLTPRRCQFPITVSAQSWRPISMIVLSTSARFSSLGILSGSRRRAEYHIVSLTVSVPIKLSSCVTYAWGGRSNHRICRRQRDCLNLITTRHERSSKGSPQLQRKASSFGHW